MNLDDVKELAKKELENSPEKRGCVSHYLSQVTPQRDLLSVDKLRVGDTFFHKVTGGKSRPWLVLWVKKGFVGCASLTHSNLGAGYEAECRFWKGSYIGPTLTIIPVERVLDAVYFPYTNLKHLKWVRGEIARKWG